MMYNLFVKFQKMVKEVIVIITVKELSAANSRERRCWNKLPPFFSGQELIVPNNEVKTYPKIY